MDILIRFAEKEELEKVNILRKQVNDLHVNGRPDIFREGFCTQMQDHIYTMYESENSDIIVAVSGDDILGFATVEYILKPLSPYSLERKIYQICEFGVDKKHHRKGIATKLVDFMKQDAASKGYSRIELDVWEFNETAIEFYNAIGFKPYRRYMELPIWIIIPNVNFRY